MSFDQIFDLIAGVYFNFYNMQYQKLCKKVLFGPGPSSYVRQGVYITSDNNVLSDAKRVEAFFFLAPNFLSHQFLWRLIIKFAVSEVSNCLGSAWSFLRTAFSYFPNLFSAESFFIIP